MNVNVYQIILFVILLFTLVYLLFVHSLTTSCKLPQESDVGNVVEKRERNSNVLYELFPKVIYRTHSSLVVSDAMKRLCHDKWIKLNPEFTMKWYTNEQVDSYMSTMPERVHNAYKKLKPGAYKADLWRMCILFEHGGYYFDSYTTPMMPIYDMLESTGVKTIESDQYMVSVNETIDNGIHQGVLMVTPEHPFIFQCIQSIVENVENEVYGETPWDITGPRCFYSTICKTLKTNGYKIDDDQKNFELGENVYGDLSFYLFKFTKPMQHVKTIKSDNSRERLILKKKFSQLQHIYRKHLHENTYSDLWKKRKVYNTTTMM